MPKEPIYWDNSGVQVREAVLELVGMFLKSNLQLNSMGKKKARSKWSDLTPAERQKLEEHGIMPFPYTINQKFIFDVGDKVICNNHIGYIRVVCSGKLEGMVEVALDRGIVCITASYPDCYPI